MAAGDADRLMATGLSSGSATEMIALFGTGTGTGNVVGPSSASVGNLATYSAVTGKAIGDSGVAASSLVSTGIANTFTAAQTFSGGIAGALTGTASGNLALGGGNLTGAVNNTGVFNTTNTAGYQQNGATIVSQTSAINGSLTLGAGAGAALPAGSIYSTFVGYGAGAAFTGATGEATFVGTIAGNKVTTGNFNSAFGEHALGYETTGGLNSFFGNDSGRNGIGMTANSGFGRASMYMYFGQQSVAVGVNALQGNAAAIYINGAITGGGGDTVTLTVTSAAIAGGFTTAAYTSVPGDTLATFATNLTAALQANTAFTGATGGMGAQTIGNPSNFILISYPGNSTIGTAGSLTITSASTGSAGVTAAITGGVASTATSNIGIGNDAMFGFAMTTASNNIAMGNNAMQAIVSGSYNIGLGGGCLSLLTSGTQNVFIGGNNGTALTTGSNSVGIGYNALNALATASNAVAVGAFAGAATTVSGTYIGVFAGQRLTSGVSNVALGFSAMQGAVGSTASSCVALGAGALNLVSSAAGDIAAGLNAGAAVTSGSYNTLVGYQVGHTTLTTGGNNIWITAGNTAYDPGNNSNTLFIGANNVGAITGTALSTTPLLTMPGGSLTLGVANTTGATLVLEGATSGAVTVTVPAIAGATALTLTHGGSGQTNVSAPTAPASTSVYAMQGLAGAITPASSGTVLIMISGTIVDPSGTAAGNGIQYQISYGTGTAPVNAAALTGTQAGTVGKFTSPTTVVAADVNQPFTTQVVVSGLTKGTTYWLDLAAESIATISSMGLSAVSVSSIELL
jgi:hypothetical protein